MWTIVSPKRSPPQPKANFVETHACICSAFFRSTSVWFGIYLYLTLIFSKLLSPRLSLRRSLSRSLSVSLRRRTSTTRHARREIHGYRRTHVQGGDCRTVPLISSEAIPLDKEVCVRASAHDGVYKIDKAQFTSVAKFHWD